MREFTALRDVDVMDGKDCLSSFSVRYTFTIHAGRKAVTWQNATEGFGPAEDPTVEILTVEMCWGPNDHWHKVKGDAFDMLTQEIPDAWFIAQATEEANA